MSGAPIPRPDAGYHEPPAASARSHVVHSPSGILFVGLGCGSFGVFLGFIGDFNPALNILGWLLGSLGAIGFVAAFTAADARRRADPWFVDRRWVFWLRVLVLFVGLLAVIMNSWCFADYLSTLKF